MSRRLIVMRHAKSSWSDDMLSDHERPLNDRGRFEAPLVARKLIELGWVPDLVLSSDAERTRETWECMEGAFEEAIEVRWLPSFYHAGMNEVFEALDELEEEETILVLGHNPGWEGVVSWLSAEQISMTTANAALLEAEGESWEEALEQGIWELIDVIRPKEL
ncbi:MAG: SixA phosphatase family protein [Bradymonadaceae bacterium]